MTAYEAVDNAHLHLPDLVFHRTLALNALAQHNYSAFDVESNSLVEARTKHFMQNTQGEKVFLKQTFDVLADRYNEETSKQCSESDEASENNEEREC